MGYNPSGHMVDLSVLSLVWCFFYIVKYVIRSRYCIVTLLSNIIRQLQLCWKTRFVDFNLSDLTCVDPMLHFPTFFFPPSRFKFCVFGGLSHSFLLFNFMYVPWVSTGKPKKKSLFSTRSPQNTKLQIWLMKKLRFGTIVLEGSQR